MQQVEGGWLVIAPSTARKAIQKEFAERGFLPGDNKVVKQENQNEFHMLCTYKWDAMVFEAKADGRPLA